MKNIFSIALSITILCSNHTKACSILYYIDKVTGKIYAVNNEDYWYNVKPYIKIIPADTKNLARLWYGWDNFAQGGINEAGLFFDGATTPQEPDITGYTKPKNNLGDYILAKCKTVREAVDFLELNKIALTNGHLLFGDKTGNAMVVEWVNGKRNLIPITGNRLMTTNFLLTDTTKGNYPCPRYTAMEKEILRLEQSKDTIKLLQIGNVAGRAVQLKNKDAEGHEGGTLYSSFIDITDMKFVLIYKLDNTRITKLDLKKEFVKDKKQTINLE